MTDRLVEKIKERITALKRECEPFNTTRIHELEQVLKLIEETEDGRRFGRDDLGRCRMRGCNLCDVRKEQLQKKWIPCSEGLPEYERCVLVQYVGTRWDDKRKFTDCTIARRRKTHGDWSGEFMGEILDVLAWQPLPPAWKGEQHEN